MKHVISTAFMHMKAVMAIFRDRRSQAFTDPIPMNFGRVFFVVLKSSVLWETPGMVRENHFSMVRSILRSPVKMQNLRSSLESCS